MLAESCEKRGDLKGMLEYTRMAMGYVREQQNKFNKVSLVEMEKMIDDADLENENLRLTVANQRKQNLIIVVGSVALLATGLCVALIIRGRMKRKSVSLENKLVIARLSEQMLHNLIGGENPVTEEDFVRLRDAMLKATPNFVAALDRLGLRPKEYQDALLVKINVPQKVCAIYFGVTPPAMANSRKRLLRKYDPEGKFKNWKEYIDNL